MKLEMKVGVIFLMKLRQNHKKTTQTAQEIKAKRLRNRILRQCTVAERWKTMFWSFTRGWIWAIIDWADGLEIRYQKTTQQTLIQKTVWATDGGQFNLIRRGCSFEMFYGCQKRTQRGSNRTSAVWHHTHSALMSLISFRSQSLQERAWFQNESNKNHSNMKH